MQKFDVKGMSCAACGARVEKTVSALDGVTSCSVSLLTNSMQVEGSASSEAIIAAVERAGYFAAVKGAAGSAAGVKSEGRDSALGGLIKRTISSAVVLVVLMYASMGGVMFGFPLPAFFDGNPVAIALVELLLALVVIVINRAFFTSGAKSLIRRAPNMDALVSVGSGAAFAYSLVVTFTMTSAVASGDVGYATELLHSLYFESAAMILALIDIGKTLEAYAKGKTTAAITALAALTPDEAVILDGEVEKVVPASSVKVGDLFVVRTGARVPVDGVIVSGGCSMDESALTGESVPVEKDEGGEVGGGCVCASGYAVCKATRVGEDSTVAKIIKLVEETAASKAPIARLADKVSGVFVPVVMLIAVVTTIVWLALGGGAGFAIARGVSVLVISCPCALGLATPVAIMVASGVGARRGVLFKSAAAIETAGRVKIVVLDKTGTVTEGKPIVTDVVAPSYDENELKRLAYSLEKRSEHPLGKAIAAGCEGAGEYDVDDFRVTSGLGVSGVIRGKTVAVGKAKSLAGENRAFDDKIAELSAAGKTVTLVTENGEAIGLIAVADVPKPDSADAISRLKASGKRVVILTGDDERVAARVAAQAGVDEVFADAMPADKARIVQELKAQGCVAMVGDGVNDAPALTAADLGIAIEAGTDVAIECADVVLGGNSLSGVATAVELGAKTLRNIKENLFWAFAYNTLGIPLAAGAFAFAGVALSPMIGAAAMSLSSVCVVSNALRLNLFKPKTAKNDGKIAEIAAKSGETDKYDDYNEDGKPVKGENIMVIKVEGMMCMHCAGRVKAAVEAVKGVTSAEINLEKGAATVNGSADRAAVVAAIVAAGYKAE